MGFGFLSVERADTPDVERADPPDVERADPAGSRPEIAVRVSAYRRRPVRARSWR
jgi:hypothetical protein